MMMMMMKIFWWFFLDYLDRSILRPSSIHPPFERPTAPRDAAGPATDASQVLEWPLGLWPTCSLVHSVATKNLSPQQKIADNPRYDWDIPFFFGWEMIGICDGFVRSMAAIDAEKMRRVAFEFKVLEMLFRWVSLSRWWKTNDLKVEKIANINAKVVQRCKNLRWVMQWLTAFASGRRTESKNVKIELMIWGRWKTASKWVEIYICCSIMLFETQANNSKCVESTGWNRPKYLWPSHVFNVFNVHGWFQAFASRFRQGFPGFCWGIAYRWIHGMQRWPPCQVSSVF